MDDDTVASHELDVAIAYDELEGYDYCDYYD